jgi:3-methyladenine DNA glycosylase AlkD
MNLNEIVAFLDGKKNLSNLSGMAKFGISTINTYGISMPVLRQKAKEIGTDHQLAIGLFGTGIHEAKILAALIDDPSQVHQRQMEKWLKGFDSWDVTDQVCTILFDKTVHAWKMAIKWPPARANMRSVLPIQRWRAWQFMIRFHPTADSGPCFRISFMGPKMTGTM